MGKIAIKISVLVCTLLIGIELPIREAKSQTARPCIVFVNGWQNCCSWGMNSLQTRLFNEMNAEPRYIPYSNFNDGGKSGNTSDDAQFLRDGENFINNQLDRSRPLILIGHSFGGDSVLKLLPRINRRIQFVGVIDPVTTGGFRYPGNYNVPRNVDYFFNRWQENVPFPNNFKTNGVIPCSATKCDQDSQFAFTDTNGKPVREKCKLLEACKTKQVRIGHQSLPTDAWIQQVIGDRIKEQLASYSPPSQPVPAMQDVLTIPSTIRSINFTSELIGNAVGDGGVILRTGDGGASWVRGQSGVSTNLNSVNFTSELIGNAVGNGGVILRTGNGGASWVRGNK